mgnify:FL=1
MWTKIKEFLKWAVANDAKAKVVEPVVEEKVTDDDWRESTVREREEELERARDEKGQYVGDDDSTPDVNEAWTGGKAPSKSGLHKKKKKKKRK